MKQTICYLYEYEHNKQSRNVGFIKCIFQQEKVTFQIHGKGLECDKTVDLEMFLFTQTKTGVKLDRTGVVEGSRGVVNYRIVVEQMNMEKWNQYDGIILIAPNDRRYVATWKRKEVNLDYKDEVQEPCCEMQVQKEVRESCCEVVEESCCEVSEESCYEIAEEPCCEVKKEPCCEVKKEPCCEITKEPCCEVEKEPCCEIEVSGITYEKIQRQDIARLQQREWRIANNNFLIHGYANYKHLLLVREDGKLYLGVPGVYHKKEAEAAHSFGFSGFHRIENDEFFTLLDESEYSPEEGFGYWCRPVAERRMR